MLLIVLLTACEGEPAFTATDPDVPDSSDTPWDQVCPRYFGPHVLGDWRSYRMWQDDDPDYELGYQVAVTSASDDGTTIVREDRIYDEDSGEFEPVQTLRYSCDDDGAWFHEWISLLDSFEYHWESEPGGVLYWPAGLAEGDTFIRDLAWLYAPEDRDAVGSLYQALYRLGATETRTVEAGEFQAAKVEYWRFEDDYWDGDAPSTTAYRDPSLGLIESTSIGSDGGELGEMLIDFIVSAP